MYEGFTDRARKAMQLANQEAQRLYHEYIDTEHVLLGLLKEGCGAGANVLKHLDISLPKIRLEVEKIVKAGRERVTAGKLPQTPQVKKVIEHSIEESRSLYHKYVGTEHILLGLLREEQGVAAQVLRNLGLKLEDVRAEVLKLLGRNLGSGERSALSNLSEVTDTDLSELAPETQGAVCQLEVQIGKLNQEKELAVAAHDLEKAASLRDRADRLKRKIQSLIRLLE